MSDSPESPRYGPAGEEPTRQAGWPPQPGQGYPPPAAPPYGSGDQGHQPGYQDGHQGAYPPPGAYGQPSGGYGQPPGGYGQPTGGYGQPYDAYGQPTGGYGQPVGYGYPPQQGAYGWRPSRDETTMAMLAHLLGLLTSFVGPLVLYLVKKDESPYVRSQAAEALNFQLTLMIAYFVSWVLAFVLIGFLLIFVLWIGSLALMIMAAVAANRGESYRYPMNIRFVS
ncbi:MULTISPECIES: DUF4870 domain-containing protein [Streptosporangium]|uniref:Tic20 family protein n=1 Tax=Streptosporangium brasiliense TaxID=47480 RepID=A0ABT9QWJ5_9ACTN|nr:DUF4870 domain-containing protein [Streptosporangium brasiliense]MDP9861354.1 putative Tic20 family protein [Streptosporangium brasiliense]